MKAVVYVVTVATLVLVLDNCLPRSQPTVVVLTEEMKQEYYSQLVRRWEAEWHRRRMETPPLPSLYDIYLGVTFFELPPNELATCDFKPPSRIRIGADKWFGGCVPHELGHRAAWLIGHKCWDNFEHYNESC